MENICNKNFGFVFLFVFGFDFAFGVWCLFVSLITRIKANWAVSS